MDRSESRGEGFSLIVCTYQRPEALCTLLKSVRGQSRYPDEILIIDGSQDDKTTKMLQEHVFERLKYYKVEEQDRGLTRQRNFGIQRLSEHSGVVFFLDDDTVLDENYFREILSTYEEQPEAVGVSGVITNESVWKKVPASYKPRKGEFVYDGWVRTEGSRFELRRKFNLAPDVPPGRMPDFSHGYSTGFLPPSGKIYEVDFFMGCCMSFNRKVLNRILFSSYFEGYGLYEDMDFCLRASEYGELYVNTRAKLEHYHDQAGRPNKYSYGKMVVRNGWYVWREKNPSPDFVTILKWNSITLLLMLVRLTNILNTRQRKEALTESLGRLTGWFALLFNKPKRVRE